MPPTLLLAGAALSLAPGLASLAAQTGAWWDWERDLVHWVTCTAHHDALGAVFLAFQVKWLPVVLVVLVLAWLARRHARTALRALFAAGVGWGLAMLLADVLWAHVDRARPPQAYAQVLRTPEELATCASRPDALALRGPGAHSRSFPSRHGLSIGVFVLALGLAHRRAGLLAALYGLVVCYGRVYAGKHWPSDLLGGVALGAGLAWLCWAAYPPVARALRLEAGDAPRA